MPTAHPLCRSNNYMNLKLTAVLLGIVLFTRLGSAADVGTIAIVENGEALTATLNGAPFGAIVTPLGSAPGTEHWIVVLPPTYTLAPAIIGGGPISLAEPEDPQTHNLILPLGVSALDWLSDVPGAAGINIPDSVGQLAPDCVPAINNIITIQGGVTTPQGLTYTLLLADQVPDGGSTLALSSFALVALGTLRAKIRK